MPSASVQTIKDANPDGGLGVHLTTSFVKPGLAEPDASVSWATRVDVTQQQSENQRSKLGALYLYFGIDCDGGN
eukprot:SAG31_NODE_2211_length_6179_cov_2.919572_11_plen_74_part_00